MGSPQRQPSYPPDQPDRPSRQGPQLENLRQVDKLDKEVSSGWRFGFWWVWALVIVGIWWVGYGWGGSGGWLRPHHNAVQNDAAISGPGIDMLNAENKSQFVNQAFQLRNVPVERRASNRAIWIGPKFNSVPTLLILPTGNNPESASIGQGSWIDTNGRIYAAPQAAQAKRQWGLSDADVQQLEKQGAYMQATVIQQVPR
jgi:hypothetical protein